jgi:hypothetical protein
MIQEKPPMKIASESEEKNLIDYYKKELEKRVGIEKTDFDLAVIDRIIQTSEGEIAARNLYKERVGVNFRGFSSEHTEENLRDGAVFSADQEKGRLRKIDTDQDDSTDRGVWGK